MSDWILLVLGAILGVGADRTVRVLEPHFRRYLSIRAQARIRREFDKTSKAALAFYRQSGLESNLYSPRTVSTGTIPVLHHSEITPFSVAMGSDPTVNIVRSNRNDLDYEKSSIAKRRRAGVRLWDGNILYVEQSQVTEGKLVIQCAVGNYFSYVSFVDKLAKAYASRRPSQVLSAYRSATDVISGTVRPVALSAATVCIFESDGRLVAALHRRSDSVISAAGVLAAIPVFGLESNAAGGLTSKYGVLFYNFVKEFIEEFYGLEELVQAAESSRLSPDWVMDLPQARELLREFDEGRASLKCLGVGVECVDGAVTFALVARFTSPEFLQSLRNTANPGWEAMAMTSGGRAVGFLDLCGSESGDVMNITDMSATSIYALDLVRLSECGP